MTPLAHKLVHLPQTGRAADPFQERLKREYERGAAEAEAASDRRAEERLAALAKELTDAHQAERARWASEQGEKLAGDLGQALAAMQTTLRDEVARLLMPFLENQLRGKAVAEFQEALSTLLRHDKGARIAIRGPGDLVERIVTKELAPFCDVTIGDECGIGAVCGATLIETHFHDWLAALDKGEA